MADSSWMKPRMARLSLAFTGMTKRPSRMVISDFWSTQPAVFASPIICRIRFSMPPCLRRMLWRISKSSVEALSGISPLSSTSRLASVKMLRSMKMFSISDLSCGNSLALSERPKRSMASNTFNDGFKANKSSTLKHVPSICIWWKASRKSWKSRTGKGTPVCSRRRNSSVCSKLFTMRALSQENAISSAFSKPI